MGQSGLIWFLVDPRRPYRLVVIGGLLLPFAGGPWCSPIRQLLLPFSRGSSSSSPMAPCPLPLLLFRQLARMQGPAVGSSEGEGGARAADVAIAVGDGVARRPRADSD